MVAGGGSAEELVRRAWKMPGGAGKGRESWSYAGHRGKDKELERDAAEKR